MTALKTALKEALGSQRSPEIMPAEQALFSSYSAKDNYVGQYESVQESALKVTQDLRNLVRTRKLTSYGFRQYKRLADQHFASGLGIKWADLENTVNADVSITPRTRKAILGIFRRYPTTESWTLEGVREMEELEVDILAGEAYQKTTRPYRALRDSIGQMHRWTLKMSPDRQCAMLPAVKEAEKALAAMGKALGKIGRVV